MEATGLLLLKLSEALRRENMVRASGKLGGVAGVLAGVHICGKETGGQGRRAARHGASALSAAAPVPPAEPQLREGHGGTWGTSPHGPSPLLAGGGPGSHLTMPHTPSPPRTATQQPLVWAVLQLPCFANSFWVLPAGSGYLGL